MRFRMLLESKGDTSSKVINSLRITPKVDECIKKRLIMKKDPLCGGSFFVLIFCCLWTTTQSSSNIYDRFCVRNFGCDTDFQDMALGVPTPQKCQELCDLNAECQYFTWWSSGMFKNICMHHTSCEKLDFKCRYCHAGPRSSGCPLRRRNNNGSSTNRRRARNSHHMSSNAAARRQTRDRPRDRATAVSRNF